MNKNFKLATNLGSNKRIYLKLPYIQDYKSWPFT